MRKYIIVGFGLLTSLSVWAVDCEKPDVDKADSPDFIRGIVDCEQETTPWFGQERKEKSVKKRKVIKTYEANNLTNSVPSGANSLIKETPVVPTKTLGGAPHHAGTTFIIREPFRLDGEHGPVAAVTVIAAMNQQMASYCSLGWEKEREWVEPAEQGYYLHYQFTCLEGSQSPR